MKARVLFVAAMLLAASGDVSAEDNNSVTIRNGTGRSLDYLFVSPGDSRYWGANVLGAQGSLGIGGEKRLEVGYPSPCAELDVAGGTRDGSSWAVVGRRICDGRAALVVLTAGDAADEPPFEPFVAVEFENGTGRAIRELYFTPGDSGIWGVDHLAGGSGLAPGASVTLWLPTPDGAVDFGVRAADDAGASYSFAVAVDDEQERLVFEILPEWRDEPL